MKTLFVKRFLNALHRYASLMFGALWLIQALTGLLLVFRWELDDATIHGTRRPLDLPAIERRIDVLQAESPGSFASSLWTSASGRDRYDLVLKEKVSGAERTWRVDGMGNILRVADPARPLSAGTFFDTLTKFHTTLFLGDLGAIFIGLSGLLLCTNVALGLKLAWPGKERWRRSLRLALNGPLRNRLLSWHRALGLWLVLPAFTLLAAGTALTQADVIKSLMSVKTPTPISTRIVNAAAPKKLTDVVNGALSLFPSARLSGVILPTEESPWYAVRLRQSEEPERVFGKTTVFVDAKTGRPILIRDAVKSLPSSRAIDFLYPLHTGQAFRMPGRIAALMIGFWLLAMISLGIALFLSRQGRAKTPHKKAEF